MRKIKKWTIAEERYLKEKYGELSAKELAAHLGRGIQSVQGRLAYLNIKKPVKEYIVYKGDDVIALGTADECAARLGVTTNHITRMTTPYHHRKMSLYKNTTVAFVVQE